MVPDTRTLRPDAPAGDRRKAPGDGLALTSTQLVEFYRIMVTSRGIDDREITLKRQNKTFFQISSAGHEAIGVAMAAHLRPAHDWFYLYYRDRALSLALGQTPFEHFLQAVAAEADPASGGRQMPCHFCDPRLNITSMSSPTGTQFLQAVGCAEGGRRAAGLPSMRKRVGQVEEDEVVLVSAGEGATSEGEFWEALNTACTLKLPVIFLIEDNGYAISVPVEIQTAGGSISRLASSFPDLFIAKCDGTDVIDSYKASRAAVHHCRRGRGPALVHASTIRPYSHSMSDDERAYRTVEERFAEEERDPLTRTRQLLLDLKVATAEELDRIETEAHVAVREAASEAIGQPQPPPERALVNLYSETAPPTRPEFDTEASAEFDRRSKQLTMVDLINRCLGDEMERDPRIVVFGQDVADASREEALEHVQGKGGVFKVTHGLQKRFGSDRVFNSPLAEANIVGRAIGMAARGLKPVVEIQFFDYIWPAFMQIRNELATMRYRSNSAFDAPVVIRVPFGGYLTGGGIYHSQTGASLFTHTPGLRVVLPSNAVDASGLLRTAIRCDDPVIFLEHKHLYRQVYNKSREPGRDFMIPFGKARVAREGSDLTIVTCGALVKRSLDAARVASERDGIEAEIVDLRSLSPFDMDAIATSVRKTNRVLVAYEDGLSWGYGAEIAARVADELFEWLDAPVRRIASRDCWVAYAPQLEEVILPQVPDVVAAIRELAAY